MSESVKISYNTTDLMRELGYRVFEEGSDRTRLASSVQYGLLGCDVLGNENPDGKRFVLDIDNVVSPYESTFSDHNDVRKVNPRRFEKVFSRLLSLRLQEKNDNGIFMSGVEQPTLYYLAGLDRLDGTDLTALREELLRIELMNGEFGEEERTLFTRLTDAEQRVILRFLIISEEQLEFTHCLEMALLCFFTDDCHMGRLYFDETDQRLLFWTEMEWSEHNECAAQLIRRLFCGAMYPLEFLWKQCCGVIGYNNTMTMDAIRIV